MDVYAEKLSNFRDHFKDTFFKERKMFFFFAFCSLICIFVPNNTRLTNSYNDL